MLTLAALSLIAFSQPADARSFGDWRVACNHSLRCVALDMPEDDTAESALRASMRITRDARNGRTTVEIWPDRNVSDPVTITAGRSVVFNGRVRGDVIRLIGEDASRAALAATKPDSDSIVIRTRDGRSLGTVGLDGLDDAMRYITTRQRRGALS